MSQLHKHFTSDQVKELLERYLRNEIERKHLQEILGINPLSPVPKSSQRKPFSLQSISNQTPVSINQRHLLP